MHFSEKKAFPSDAMKIRGQHIAPVILGRKIPRFQILCGSRLRPESAVRVLRLKDARREDVQDGKKVGRVSMVSGLYTSRFWGESVRILVGETQMGHNAVDIVGREYIYSADGQPIYQIRCGTAGGVNNVLLSHPVLKIGDIAIPTSNIGRSGAIEQSLGFFQNIVNCKEQADGTLLFLKHLREMQIEIVFDGKFYKINNDENIVKALACSASRLGVSFYLGRNFSKESLYAESAEGLLAELRNKYKVICSEMEQLAHAYLASFARSNYGIKVFSGMVAAIIGAIPGSGFPNQNDKRQIHLQKKTEENALLISAEALAMLSANEKRKG